jgi:N-acetylglucosamine-6-sulfatase
MWAGSFDTVGTDPPDWRADLRRLSESRLSKATLFTRQRVQSLQAVSELIDALRERLGTKMENTYLVFTSDNGFFLGQHRLWNGKGTAYDHDVRVPLVIVPPGGLDQPRTVTEVVQNVDLAPTFAAIAGAPLVLPTDGMSLLPWLGGPEDLPTTWRDGALVTFTDDDKAFGPDRSKTSMLIPSYQALRTTAYLYIDNGTIDNSPPVDHDDGEFYWLANDAAQIDNRYDDLTTRQRQDLNDALIEFGSCQAAACPAINLPEVTPLRP